MVARNTNGTLGNNRLDGRRRECAETRACHEGGQRIERGGRPRSDSHRFLGVSYEDLKGTKFETKMTKGQFASMVIALTCGSLFCMVFGA